MWSKNVERWFHQIMQMEAMDINTVFISSKSFQAHHIKSNRTCLTTSKWISELQMFSFQANLMGPVTDSCWLKLDLAALCTEAKKGRYNFKFNTQLNPDCEISPLLNTSCWNIKTSDFIALEYFNLKAICLNLRGLNYPLWNSRWFQKLDCSQIQTVFKKLYSGCSN